MIQGSKRKRQTLKLGGGIQRTENRHPQGKKTKAGNRTNINNSRRSFRNKKRLKLHTKGHTTFLTLLTQSSQHQGLILGK